MAAMLLAIRAHIRYYMAEAICSTHTSYHQWGRSMPDSAHFRYFLFDKEVDRVFGKASVGFFDSFLPLTSNLTVLEKGFKVGSLLCMVIFLSVRKMAWKEARQSNSTDDCIRRTRRHELEGSMH